MENLIKGFKENKAFRITSLLVLLLILIAVLAPVIAPYNPLEAVMRDANAAPSAAHLLGRTSWDVTYCPVSCMEPAIP